MTFPFRTRVCGSFRIGAALAVAVGLVLPATHLSAWQGNDAADTAVVIRPNHIIDGNFASFASAQIRNPEQATGQWGTGDYSRNGIWWISGGAQVQFRSVSLDAGYSSPPGIRSALRIDNRSPAAPNRYGTTSQRVWLEHSGAAYRLSFLARARDLQPNGLVVAAGSAWTEVIKLPPGSYGWRHFSAKIAIPPNSAPDNQFVDIRILSKDRGSVDLTDFKLRRTLAEGESERVVALLVIDTDSNLTEIVEINRRMVQELLVASLGGRLHLTVLQGRDANPQRVMDYYRGLDSQPTDTLLFYYTGHGGTEARHGHMLTMKHGLLARDSLRSVMEEKPGRLKVLLTDCCSNNFELQSAPKLLPRSFNVSAVHGLLLRHHGLVDMTAASPGEYAFGNNVTGCFMTKAFVNALTAQTSELDADRSGLLTWKEFFIHVRNRTKAEYSSIRQGIIKLPDGRRDRVQQTIVDQKFQTPYAFKSNASPSVWLR